MWRLMDLGLCGRVARFGSYHEAESARVILRGMGWTTLIVVRG